MDGVGELLTLETQTREKHPIVMMLEKKVEELNQWENKLGLPDQPFLEICQEDLAKLSAEQTGELAGEVSLYGILLQKEVSKQTAFASFLEDKIKLAIANELNSYEGYYNAEQRKYVAIANNEYAKKMEEIRINTKLKVDLLSSLPYQLNQFQKSLIELQQTKRQKENYR